VSNSILDRVFRYSRARRADRLVLLVLADRADDAGSCYPGIDDIASRAGVNRATVFRSQARLVKQLGELRVESGGAGRGDTNRYTVTVDADRSTSERVAACDPAAQRKGSHPRAKGSHPRSERVAGCDPNPQEPNEPSLARARSRTHARRRSAARTGPAPDPRVKSVLDAFCAAHSQTLGQPYLVQGGRDGAWLKKALATYDEPTIQRAIAAYFVDRDARVKFKADVPHFVGRIAALASRRGPARPEPEDRTGIGQARAAARAAGREEPR
jgi:hypothetical protein